MKRTQILSEMQLTLEPPCHPDHENNPTYSIDTNLRRPTISQGNQSLTKHHIATMYIGTNMSVLNNLLDGDVNPLSFYQPTSLI